MVAYAKKLMTGHDPVRMWGSLGGIALTILAAFILYTHLPLK
jgi:hypothetical protein